MARLVHISAHLKSINQLVSNKPKILSSIRSNAILPVSNIRFEDIMLNITQTRFGHTDIEVPDFTEYRRDKTKSPQSVNSETIDDRRAFTNAFAAISSIAAVYSTKAIAIHYIASMAASADVLALSKIEIKLASIPEGKNMTFKWRGKPLFVRNRPEAVVASMRSVDMGLLRDPEPDEARVKEARWLVVIGVCTHLGCVPVADAGDYAGGYYCPCHGSHYDASGRIRKGPAPTNLEVPDYIFPDAETLIVG